MRSYASNIYNIIKIGYVLSYIVFLCTAEESAEAADVRAVPAFEEEPKVPPRGQRHNPFNKPAEGDTKAVPGSRHCKY